MSDREREEWYYKCRMLSGLLGMDIKTPNQYKLACAGAAKDIVEKDEISAEIYQMLAPKPVFDSEQLLRDLIDGKKEGKEQESSRAESQDKDSLE